MINGTKCEAIKLGGMGADPRPSHRCHRQSTDRGQAAGRLGIRPLRPQDVKFHFATTASRGALWQGEGPNTPPFQVSTNFSCFFPPLGLPPT